jgi:hypothetical protein
MLRYLLSKYSTLAARSILIRPSIDRFKNITLIDISNNHLLELPLDLLVKQCDELEEVKAEGNDITDIHYSHTKVHYRLINLLLKNNKLTSFNFDKILYEFRYLTNIDLSQNPLNSFVWDERIKRNVLPVIDVRKTQLDRTRIDLLILNYRNMIDDPLQDHMLTCPACDNRGSNPVCMTQICLGGCAVAGPIALTLALFLTPAVTNLLYPMTICTIGTCGGCIGGIPLGGCLGCTSDVCVACCKAYWHAKKIAHENILHDKEQTEDDHSIELN